MVFIRQFSDALAIARSHPVLLLLFCLVAPLVLLLLNPRRLYRMWQLRHVPGGRTVPFLGNLPHMIKYGSPSLFMAYTKAYGHVFKVWVGRQVVVVLTDPELVRSVAYKSINRTPLFSVLQGDLRKVAESDLVAARDNDWRVLRGMWQPAFSSASLSGYLPLMDDSARTFTHMMAARAAGGERLNVHQELGRMTLQVVGSCAFGVDFKCLQEGKAEDGTQGSEADEGKVLASACQAIFETNSIQRGSMWGRLNIMLPELAPLVRWLAHTFPDARLRRQLEARTLVMNTAINLIKSWTAAAAAAAGGPAAAGQVDAKGPAQQAADDADSTSSWVMLNKGKADEGSQPGSGAESPVSAAAAGPAAPAAAAAAPPPPGSGLRAVAPGSFLGLMLAARDKGNGEKLTDLQIIAQAQVFILAGYETTANALAFAIYLISKHPHVQEKLVAEIEQQLELLGGLDAPLTEDAVAQFEYTAAVINEAMRLLPPAHVTSRQLKEPLTVGKYALPAGTAVLLSIHVLHHDAALWDDPEEFRPERFLKGADTKPNTFIPFGIGTRMCIGYKFALLEARIALIRLYSRLTFKLEPGQDPLHVAYGITAGPRHGIWVTPQLRSPP